MDLRTTPEKLHIAGSSGKYFCFKPASGLRVLPKLRVVVGF